MTTAALGADALEGHADRPVTVVTHDGRPAVRKSYGRGGADAVHQQLAALWASSFGIRRRPPGLPEPLALDADGAAVVMALVPGVPLARRRDVGDAVLRSAEVAALLADLHGCGVTVPRRRDPAKLLHSARRKSEDLLDTARTREQRAVAVACRAVVEELDHLRLPAAPLVVSHGDFSPRNVLAGPDGLVLIDLDRVQMAEPARDLTYWGAWVWVTLLQAGQRPSWDAADRLVDDYADHRPGVRSTPPSSWGFHRAVALLRAVHGWSALTTDPGLSMVVVAEAARVVGAMTVLGAPRGDGSRLVS